jgi:hypothetical protein
MESPDPRSAVLLAQGGYYAATGVVPFLSRRLFERVTGPKREWWLVQTVGVMVAATGGAMLSAALRRRPSPEIVGMATGCAVGLAAVDVVYVAKRRISPVYLLDALVQLAFAGGFAAPIAQRRREPGRVGGVG